MAELVRRAAAEVVGEDRVRTDPGRAHHRLGGFLRIQRRVPGCYFFVGCRDEARGAVHPHHSPHFDICEDSLPTAVEVLEAAALRILDGGDAAARRRGGS
jgi:amidohydrolase